MDDRIQAWKHAFEGDVQGVLPTLINLAWNFAAFSTIVELVRHAPDNDRGGKEVNSMMFDLLASSYWGSTVMAIRRLVDAAPLAGDRGVCSLRSIVNDAKVHRAQLTRRVYVESIAGLEYDFEDTRDRHWQFVMSQEPGPVHVPRELWYEPSEQRHQEFDWLSGVAEVDRTPDDIIRVGVFERLESRLSELDVIADHGTIYFAHAATEVSRKGRGLTGWNHDEAKASLSKLAHVAELVGRWFCFTGIGNILPTPQYDQFEFLDRPLLDGSADELQKKWLAFSDEVGQWPHIENEVL